MIIYKIYGFVTAEQVKADNAYIEKNDESIKLFEQAAQKVREGLDDYIQDPTQKEEPTLKIQTGQTHLKRAHLQLKSAPDPHSEELEKIRSATLKLLDHYIEAVGDIRSAISDEDYEGVNNSLDRLEKLDKDYEKVGKMIDEWNKKVEE